VLIPGDSRCCSGVGGHGLGRIAQGGMVTDEDPLHYLRQIPLYVEAIGNLDRLWGARGCSLGIGAGPIPANHLDLGLVPQPSGQGGGLAIGQDLAPISGATLTARGVAEQSRFLLQALKAAVLEARR
jgi:hypothetical protein